MSINAPKGHSVIDYDLARGNSNPTVNNLTVLGTLTATLVAPGALPKVTTTLGSASYNNLGASTLTGYAPGTTQILVLTPASGGSTITGLVATGIVDGFTIIIQNASATDVLIFTHLGSGSTAANRFSNVSAGSVQVLSLGAARCTYINSLWQFA